jgi:hypothetical protein
MAVTQRRDDVAALLTIVEKVAEIGNAVKPLLSPELIQLMAHWLREGRPAEYGGPFDPAALAVMVPQLRLIADRSIEIIDEVIPLVEGR